MYERTRGPVPSVPVPPRHDVDGVFGVRVELAYRVRALPLAEQVVHDAGVAVAAGRRRLHVDRVPQDGLVAGVPPQATPLVPLHGHVT